MYSMNITLVRKHEEVQEWLYDKLQTLTTLEQA